jgi:hypothetical protein
MKEQVSKSVENDAGEMGMEGIDAEQQDRMYNPLNLAPKGKVSDALNTDSARYKNGPGPV